MRGTGVRDVAIAILVVEYFQRRHRPEKVRDIVREMEQPKPGSGLRIIVYGAGNRTRAGR